MDKKDFYKRLMESYTVDTDKIKCNAKRRAVKQNNMGNIRRWVTGAGICAAAAAVVIVSLAVIPKGGIDITEENLDGAIERVYAAEARYQELLQKEEMTEMYVSFESERSLNEILIAFSAIDDNNQIRVILLYTKDGKCYQNNDQIGDNLLFLGAKITAPTGFYKELNALKCVSLAEFVEGNKYNDKSFVPYVSIPETNPVATIGEPIEIELPENTAFSETPDPSETTATANDPSVSTGSDATTPDITSDITDVTIEIPIANVKYAHFINECCLVITTSDSIRLYRITDSSAQLETTFYASNAKIAWSSRDGAMMFITACDSNGRNRLFYADGSTGTLSEADISSITSGADIASVLCSDDGTVMFIKTVTTDKSYIYHAERSGSSITLSLAKEYASAVSILACSNGKAYVAVTDPSGAAIKICSVNMENGQEQEIATISGALYCVRNGFIDTAFLTVTDNEGEESHLLLTPQGVLIETEASTVVFSDTDSNVLMLDGKYYSLNNNTLTEITAEEAGQFTASTEALSDYSVEITDNGIVIVK